MTTADGGVMRTGSRRWLPAGRLDRRLLDAGRGRLLRGVIVLGALVGTGAALGATYGMVAEPTYTANAFVVVTATSDLGLSRETGYAQAYSRIAATPDVLAAATASTGSAPAALAGEVVATASRDAPMIEISVSGRDAQRTAAIATAVTGALIDHGNRQSAATAVRLSVFSSATVPVTPSSPTPSLLALAGAGAGLLLGGLLILGPPAPLPAEARPRIPVVLPGGAGR
ncbi:lipopolysaccharide biosynthesis protein [Pseudonocardia acidicola]|uniref:Lipopolysaccharide biosynthesis protein n=1 Tax=Pseudonocardia acidicola TaxID=2724939 RepID=A0ABX1SGU1_9PSEU|nr:lipopolysaccharide biosynthesis protein [Pseudonocardia acidicola]NMI00083.1 lipopolysaccharide biosynthesis protein [Pseudonocardia acidicola]